MSILLRSSRLGLGAALALAVLPATGAWALDVVGKAPAVEVVVTGVTSQAQLTRQLNAQGYCDVKLSSVRPNPADPEPQLYRGRDNPQITPVHQGWNGTAVKNGRTLEVRVDFGGAPAVAELPD